ncbi:MAG TPA: hypothetical protein VK117_02515, partial [Pyrinomonadaceae bacterium]|nr:hypothetical protein [Pyrinomonadaceae bacterium]
YLKPKDPEGLTFTSGGITDFDVQYWDGYGWTTIESVNGNNQVLRKIVLAKSVTTIKIRVLVRKALNRRSRIVELEAWGR